MKETYEEILYQRNLLMKAISDMAMKIGITNSDISNKGPMCLMICEDIAELKERKNDQSSDPS